MTRPGFERPITIPALARRSGIPRRTLLRQLLDTHARDVADGRPTDWLYRNGPRKAWCVNFSRLRALHPERFGVPSPGEMHQQLYALEATVRELRKTLNALLAAFREHRGMHAELEAKVWRALTSERT